MEESNVIDAKLGHLALNNSAPNQPYAIRMFVVTMAVYRQVRRRLKELSVFKAHTGSMVTKQKKLELGEVLRAYSS